MKQSQVYSHTILVMFLQYFSPLFGGAQVEPGKIEIRPLDFSATNLFYSRQESTSVENKPGFLNPQPIVHKSQLDLMDGGMKHDVGHSEPIQLDLS